MAEKKKAAEVEAETPVITFSKAQLLESKRFKHRRDLLTVLLKDGVEYTMNDVESAINKFMKGKVN